MSLKIVEKHDGIPEIGFLREPKTERDWGYILRILNADEIIDNPLEELFARAYARRVTTVQKKSNLREKCNHRYRLLDLGHYNRTQTEEWVPGEMSIVSRESGHMEPSNLELSNFIADNPRISESYRVWYITTFPEMVELMPEYSEHKMVA